MKGYSQFFGEGAETKVPARSAFEVKGLAFPEWLIEIEVIAAKITVTDRIRKYKREAAPTVEKIVSNVKYVDYATYAKFKGKIKMEE